MAEIFIDSEFANYIRPLSDEEFEKLKESIKLEGIRDPLVVWNGFLIDGYHRYKIATELEIEFKTIEIDLPDKEAVKEWIIKNQLGRRNLTSQEASYYRGKLYESRKLNHGGDRKSKGQNVLLKTTAEKIAEEYGVNESTIRRDAEFSKAVDKVAEKVGKEAKNAILTGQINIPKKDVEKIIEIKEEAPEFIEPVLNGEITISKAVQETKRKKITEKLNDIETVEAKAVEGVFDVIVIDPPWPMEKIEREVAPNQVEFEYPTMTIEEIKELKIPCADDCHVWLWTTQKYLPVAFQILQAWNLKYVCTFVWHKPGGFQPFELPQYNCEFALYAKKGNPKFGDLKDFKLCFDAPRGSHSEKPDFFYNLVRRVTAGRRLDMFNRRKIEGFETWGKEAVYE
jgi:N6-adenosine-specific RNA methylase IME4